MQSHAVTTIAILSLSAACGQALASQHGARTGQPDAQEVAGAAAVELTLPVRASDERFVIADPGAASSAAWRVNADRADAIGGAPAPTAGYTVRSRVIVETGQPAMLERLMGARAAGGNAAVRASGVRGFSIVETGTVGEAASLAGDLKATGLFRSVEMDIERPRTLRGTLPNDPLFPNQWHLRNTANPIADVNAEAAWAMGYTGLGVIIGVTESGFQASHPDLNPHYVPEATQATGSSGHATSVAGIFGAVGDNGIGVAGCAYNCGISGQIIGSASQTAAAFVYRNDLNDIKNDSWGPWDNGDFWDQYAASIELQALEDCAMLGRGGLGTMTCWAAGNGGLNDRSDYDPYTSSRYTFSIAAIGDQDREASYNELGSSMLVAAHSSGNNRGTTTTTSGSSYTSGFGGTSSASPLGAGAVGLALEANPLLTWRDVQAILAETARMCDPSDSYWTTNAAGHDINYRFGFGAIDAGELVAAAETWENLPDEISATSGVVGVNQQLPDNNTTGVTETVEIADDFVVEQVVLVLNVQTPFVGDLRVAVTSPSGTESVLCTPRSFDSSDDISGFSFLSMRSFGESSAGTWSIKISDERSGSIATWTDFTLTVYGHEASAGCSDADIAEPYDVLDLADVQAFIAAFVAQEPPADLAAPFGVWDLADVQTFIPLFVAGCP